MDFGARLIDVGEDDYLTLVDTLPPTLLAEAPLALKSLDIDNGLGDDNDQTQSTLSVFASRLAFLSEFRDYLLFIRQGTKETREQAAGRLVNLMTSGISPVGFWGVLLSESIRLLEGEPEGG